MTTLSAEEQHQLLDQVDALLESGIPTTELRQAAQLAVNDLRTGLPKRARKTMTVNDLISALAEIAPEHGDKVVEFVDDQFSSFAYYVVATDNTAPVVSLIDD